MIDRCLTDQFEFFFQLSKRVRLLDSSSLIENAHVGEVGKRDNVLDTVGYADILTDFTINLTMHSFANNRLDSHIF